MTVTTLAPERQQFTIDISAESLDKTAGLTDEGSRSTSRRPCARATAWAATSCRATSTASAA
jgi:hypothetical protein